MNIRRNGGGDEGRISRRDRNRRRNRSWTRSPGVGRGGIGKTRRWRRSSKRRKMYEENVNREDIERKGM